MKKLKQNKPLSNIEINDIVTRNKFTNYFGTFNKQFSQPIPLNYWAILNLDEPFSGGTHWVGIYSDIIDNIRTLIYFDSFGAPPGMSINSYAVKNKFGMLKLQTEDLQAIKSQLCGFWCIVFGLAMTKKMNFRDFINKFHQDGFNNFDNERLIIKQFQQV